MFGRNGIQDKIKMIFQFFHGVLICDQGKMMRAQFFASASFEGEVLSMVTSAPNEAANFTAICPIRLIPYSHSMPLRTPTWRSGE
jgi:hypothetical protein